jgi:hypothetical protein
MLYAFHYQPLEGPILTVGSPVSNPSEPGEEERSGNQANRCSALKDVNGGIYVDAAFTVQPGVPNSASIRFTSPDGLIQKTVSLPPNKARFDVEYVETVSGTLYTRIGVSPNNLDIIKTGQTHLTTESSASPAFYAVKHTGGSRGGVWVTLDNGASRNATPSFAGYRNRNLSMTEEIEISGNGTYRFGIAFEPGDVPVTLSELSVE